MDLSRHSPGVNWSVNDIRSCAFIYNGNQYYACIEKCIIHGYKHTALAFNVFSIFENIDYYHI